MKPFFLYLLLLWQLALYICKPLPQDTSNESKNGKPIRSDVAKGAAKYLAKYGYATKDFADGDPTESDMKDFLTNFQTFAHIPVTGRLDATTLTKMEQPRCGMKDPKLQLKVKRSKRYVLYGTSWTNELKSDRTLTWKVVNSGRHFDVPTVRRIMYYALQKWSDAANINFKESQSDDADFLVSFRSSYHNDPWPFDGRGGTLAHAFYPFPGAASSGDIHFDDDEQFTFGKSYGTDVLWVAVHEAGHSLGLEHSQELDAVMYPWYRGSTGKDFDLRADDVQGVRALYGTRPVTTPPTPQPTEPVRPPLPTTRSTTTQSPTTKETELVRLPLPTTKATTTQSPTKKATEPITTPLPTTEAATTELPTTKATELVRPPLPTTKATTTQSPTTKETELVRPPLPTTKATITQSSTTKETELVRPPLPTTKATTTQSPTTKATEPITTPLLTTEATTTQSPTTKETELVRPPLPTTKATTTQSPTTKATEPITTPLPTTEATTTQSPTTKETEPVRPPLPTTKASTTETPTTKATEPIITPLLTTEATTTQSPTTKETEPVRPPLSTTKATSTESPVTKETEPIETTETITSKTLTSKATEPSRPPETTSASMTTAVTDDLCPRKIDAAVLLRSGWLAVFSGKSFYLISRQGKEHGPINVNKYFQRLHGKVSAAYKRKDDSVVLFTGNKYNVYNNFQLIEEAQPVTDYGLPADSFVDAALVWPGNKYARWRQGDKVYLFSGLLYYRYDTRVKTIDRSYPKVIRKLWRGLSSRVSAAFAGTPEHVWKTHFFRNNQFYIFNDRRVRIFHQYPEGLQKFLRC